MPSGQLRHSRGHSAREETSNLATRRRQPAMHSARKHLRPAKNPTIGRATCSLLFYGNACSRNSTSPAGSDPKPTTGNYASEDRFQSSGETGGWVPRDHRCHWDTARTKSGADRRIRASCQAQQVQDQTFATRSQPAGESRRSLIHLFMPALRDVPYGSSMEHHEM